MKTHQDKVDNVQAALSDLFNDTTVEPEVTASALSDVIELVEDFMNALP